MLLDHVAANRGSPVAYVLPWHIEQFEEWEEGQEMLEEELRKHQEEMINRMEPAF